MRILVDTGAWLAIFDPTDAVPDRATVAEHAERIQGMKVIIPWPITDETLSSKYAFRGWDALRRTACLTAHR